MQEQKYSKLHWIKIPVAVLCFCADMASKSWARSALGSTAEAPFVPGLLQFNLVTNTGAAFNLGSGQPIVMATIATLVTILLVAWVLFEERKASSKRGLIDIGAGFLIGGALGNLADRFMRGRVTDFIEFSFVRFPVFNCADVFIDIGVGLLILALWQGRKAGVRSESATGDTTSMSGTNSNSTLEAKVDPSTATTDEKQS